MGMEFKSVGFLVDRQSTIDCFLSIERVIRLHTVRSSRLLVARAHQSSIECTVLIN